MIVPVTTMPLQYGTDQSKWQDSWRGATLAQAQVAEDLRPISEELGCSLAQLALAWCLRDGSPVSTVIMGASRISQLEDNLGALAVRAIRLLGECGKARYSKRLCRLRAEDYALAKLPHHTTGVGTCLAAVGKWWVGV